MMTGNKFTTILEHSEQLWNLDFEELKILVRQYPYAQNLRLLLAKKAQLENKSEFGKHLNLAATYAPDRTYLYHYIKDNIPQPEEELAGSNEEVFAYDLTGALEGVASLSPSEEEILPSVPAFELLSESEIAKEEILELEQTAEADDPEIKEEETIETAAPPETVEMELEELIEEEVEEPSQEIEAVLEEIEDEEAIDMEQIAESKTDTSLEPIEETLAIEETIEKEADSIPELEPVFEEIEVKEYEVETIDMEQTAEDIPDFNKEEFVEKEIQELEESADIGIEEIVGASVVATGIIAGVTTKEQEETTPSEEDLAAAMENEADPQDNVDSPLKAELSEDAIKEEPKVDPEEDVFPETEPSEEHTKLEAEAGEQYDEDLIDLAEAEFEQPTIEQQPEEELYEEPKAADSQIPEEEENLPYEESDEIMTQETEEAITENLQEETSTAEVPETIPEEPETEEAPISFSQWLTKLQPVSSPTNKIEEEEKSKKSDEKNEEIVWTFEKPKTAKSSKKSSKKKTPKKLKKKEVKRMAKKSIRANKNLAAENLAKILVSQGKNKEAIEMYEQLILKFPEKSTYFAGKLKKLKHK